VGSSQSLQAEDCLDCQLSVTSLWGRPSRWIVSQTAWVCRASALPSAETGHGMSTHCTSSAPAVFTTQTHIYAHVNCVNGDGQKPQKSLKKWYYPTSHRLNVNVMLSSITNMQSLCQISSKSVKGSDIWWLNGFHNGAHPPSRIFKSQVFLRLAWLRVPCCITVPNIVKITQATGEILQFLWFSRWRSVGLNLARWRIWPHKFPNFNVWLAECGQYVLRCQFSSKTVHQNRPHSCEGMAI